MAPRRGPVGPLLPLPPELFPHLCAPLDLAGLACVAASSRAGCVVVECLPAQHWQSHLEDNFGVGFTRGLDNTESWCYAYALRQELRFWVKVAKPSLCKGLGLSASSGSMWKFRNMEGLKASRGMAEDALALLQSMDKDDVFGPWTRMPWMPQLSVQRLTFSFRETLDSMQKALTVSGLDIFDMSWQSHAAEVTACGVAVPCGLTLQCYRDGDSLFVELSLQVGLTRSNFPSSSETQGVQNALVIHFFSTSLGLRVAAPRCVSHASSDGEIVLVSSSTKLKSEAGAVDFSRSKHCNWVQDLLVHGEMQALVVVDTLSFMATGMQEQLGEL